MCNSGNTYKFTINVCNLLDLKLLSTFIIFENIVSKSISSKESNLTADEYILNQSILIKIYSISGKKCHLHYRYWNNAIIIYNISQWKYYSSNSLWFFFVWTEIVHLRLLKRQNLTHSKRNLSQAIMFYIAIFIKYMIARNHITNIYSARAINLGKYIYLCKIKYAAYHKNSDFVMRTIWHHSLLLLRCPYIYIFLRSISSLFFLLFILIRNAIQTFLEFNRKLYREIHKKSTCLYSLLKVIYTNSLPFFVIILNTSDVNLVSAYNFV